MKAFRYTEKHNKNPLKSFLTSIALDIGTDGTKTKAFDIGEPCVLVVETRDVNSKKVFYGTIGSAKGSTISDGDKYYDEWEKKGAVSHEIWWGKPTLIETELGEKCVLHSQFKLEYAEDVYRKIKSVT